MSPPRNPFRSFLRSRRAEKRAGASASASAGSTPVPHPPDSHDVGRRAPGHRGRAREREAVREARQPLPDAALPHWPTAPTGRQHDPAGLSHDTKISPVTHWMCRPKIARKAGKAPVRISLRPGATVRVRNCGVTPASCSPKAKKKGIVRERPVPTTGPGAFGRPRDGACCAGSRFYPAIRLPCRRNPCRREREPRREARIPRQC